MSKKQSGQTLPLFGLLVMVLFGFLAMAVDLGQGYLERRTNQAGADSASVAGMEAISKGAGDSAVKGAIKSVLIADGYSAGGIVFLTSSTSAGTDVSKVYVNAQYGTLTNNACQPLSPAVYVGSTGGSVPSGTTCVKSTVSTSKTTLFANIPLIGVAQIGASASGSAGKISVNVPAGGTTPTPTPTPTAAPWDTGIGEGFSIWGGKRADNTVLAVGDSVAFFADSGWDLSNDVQTNCQPCEYNATQNYKGLADPQCFVLPLANTCTGPNGAQGNVADGLTAGTVLEVVVVDNISHQGNENILSPIGIANITVLSDCPNTPAYLTDGTRPVCGVISYLDTGELNEGPQPTATVNTTPTVTSTNVIGNTP